jgi:hypothetical protein
MFKVISDMVRSVALQIQEDKSAKFGYLPMMATLGTLNVESFCECVLSCHTLSGKVIVSVCVWPLDQTSSPTLPVFVNFQT